MKKQFYILLLLLSFVISSCNSYGKKLEFKGTEVYYTDKVQKEDAQKLGEFLVSSEFADGKKKSVQLTKDDDSGNYIFRMVTNDKAQKEDSYDILFKAISIQISDSVFNSQAVDFHVCDNTFKTVRAIPFKDESTK